MTTSRWRLVSRTRPTPFKTTTTKPLRTLAVHVVPTAGRSSGLLIGAGPGMAGCGH